ncbi:trypsin-like peptidase domain-containing protein [Flavisolibacter sp. BT320]|nr:trypsin-like peptidase domain-containing protein [Flavisolibacter longurius]
MDDIRLLEAVEKYLAAEMSPDERSSFEDLRKSNPEVDQLVVEHSFFLQQIGRFEDVKSFKGKLAETHLHLAEVGAIQNPELRGKAKVIHLFNRYKRTAAIAASIAGITALSISALIWSVSPAKPLNKKDLETLNRNIRVIDNKVNQVKNENAALQQQISNLPDNSRAPIEYTSGGTGFLVDVKGLLFTNYHVVEKARYIAVQNHNGKDLQAKVVYTDPQRDIAILKITDTAFRSPSSIPYAIKKSTADIAEPIFSLGYPRNDIVYGEGYLAAKTGYDGDTLSVQISINANRGNSGSPIINRNGEIIGVLSARQTSVEGAVFAVQSKFIHQALNSLRKKDTSFQQAKLPTSSSLKGVDRTQQVKKITDYVYMVKVN